MEYKHKTTGHIAKLTASGKNYKVTYPQSYTIPKWIIENSNDWILEKVSAYRINTVQTDCDLEFNYNPNISLDKVVICSVYNSKNELFHIGDVVKIQAGNFYQIDGFEIENDSIYCNIKGKNNNVPRRVRRSIESISLAISKKEMESEKIISIADLMEVNHGNNDILCIRFDKILEKFRSNQEENPINK